MKKLFIFFYLSATIGIIAGDYYCDNPCTDDKNNTIQHIGCNPNELFDDKRCPRNAELVDIIPDFQSIITLVFNWYRNHFAGSSNSSHPVCRMATVQWDDKLAYLATLNVKQCQMNYDKCHNTEDFPHSGQTLFNYTSEKSEDFDFIELFVHAFSEWSERTNDMNSNEDPDLNNYLPLIIDHNTHVGCAAANSTMGELSYFWLTCNYAAGINDGKSFHTICAKAGQHCKTEIDLNYPNLCSIAESYADN